MLGIGFIVGSGIFIMPLLAAQQSGTFSLLAWAAAGFYCILTGLCFAELAALIPKAGGLYSYAHKLLGERWGFLCGYTFWTGYWITIAAEMWAIAWYLGFFVPWSDTARLAVACAIGLVLTYVNYRGVKQGGEAEDALTAIKLMALALFVVAGMLFFQPQRVLNPTGGDAPLLAGLLSSFLLALWAYQGAEIITVPEEKIKNARKTVPKAIVVSVFSVMALYLLVALVVVGSVDWRDYASSETPLADMMHSFMGGHGGIVIAIGGLVSIIGALNAVILASARISYAMARDKLFPRFFNYLHPRFETPSRALWLHFAMACLLAFALRDFEALAMLVVLFTLIPYALSSFAAMRLHRVRSFLIPKWIPYAAAAASLGLLAYALYKSLLPAVLLLGAGMLLYSLLKRKLI